MAAALIARVTGNGLALLWRPLLPHMLHVTCMSTLHARSGQGTHPCAQPLAPRHCSTPHAAHTAHALGPQRLGCAAQPAQPSSLFPAPPPPRPALPPPTHTHTLPSQDEDNQVVGAQPRDVTVRNRLLGRGAYVLVFNPQGHLFVSKRHESKVCIGPTWLTCLLP